MKHQKILELANKFVEAAAVTPTGEEFRAQRIRFINFYDQFRQQLRYIVNEMEFDILQLKMRNFNPDVLSQFIKLHYELKKIFTEIKEENPYEAAEKLVRYVADRNQGRDLIKNIDFLAKHHLKKLTHRDLPYNPSLKSLERLQLLVESLGNFMIKYPAIKKMTPSIQAPSLRENQEIIPDLRSTPDAVTKA